MSRALPSTIPKGADYGELVTKYRLHLDYADDDVFFEYFLELNGYVLDGDVYVRDSPLPIHDYKYEDLFTQEEYDAYLRDDRPVTVYQRDLESLLVDVHKIEGDAKMDYQWTTPDRFYPLYGARYKIRPEVLRLAMMLTHADDETRAAISRKVHFMPKTYPRRTHFLGPAPDGMSPSGDPTVTLADAVRDGYTFTLDMYLDEISSRTSYLLSDKTMQLVIHHLQTYPDMYPKLVDLGKILSSLVKYVLALHYPEGIVDEYQYLYSYIFNEPLEMVYPRRRVKLLRSLSKEWIDAVYKGMSFSQIYGVPPHPLEDVVAYLSSLGDDEYKLRQAARRIGMYVPLRVHVLSYIQANISDYVQVVIRHLTVPDLDVKHLDISAYTDAELWDLFGTTRSVVFTNRRTWIRDNIKRSKTPTFIVYDVLDRRRCTNIDEAEGPPYLVYGSFNSHKAVDLSRIKYKPEEIPDLKYALEEMLRRGAQDDRIQALLRSV